MQVIILSTHWKDKDGTTPYWYKSRNEYNKPTPFTRRWTYDTSILDMMDIMEQNNYKKIPAIGLFKDDPQKNDNYSLNEPALLYVTDICQRSNSERIDISYEYLGNKLNIPSKTLLGRIYRHGGPLCFCISYDQLKIIQEELGLALPDDWLILIPEYRQEDPKVFRIKVGGKDLEKYYTYFKNKYTLESFSRYAVIQSRGSKNNKAKALAEKIKKEKSYLIKEKDTIYTKKNYNGKKITEQEIILEIESRYHAIILHQMQSVEAARLNNPLNTLNESFI